MRNLSIRISLFFSSVIVAAILASCSSSSTGPGTTNTVKVPGFGSYFTMQSSTIDSNGVVILGSTTTDTVVESGEAVLGKTNVVGWRSAAGGDLGYYSYESNGDFSNLSDDGGTAAWWTYPFASQNAVALPTHVGQGYSTTTTATGAGSGSVLILGQTFSTDTLFGVILRDTTQGIAQFAPQLGWEVEEDISSTRDPFSGTMQPAHKYALIDYKLK